MSCLCPVYIRHSSGTYSFLSSSVKSYLRSNLTADSRTSPVPAILHFFILFYYFHLQMFERFINCIVSFHIVCRLRYTTSCLHPTHNPAYILSASRRMSCLCPVYVLSTSGTHSVLHLRSNLTFGTILPRILEQVLCLRYPTFLSIFISFIIDVREIYKLHCIVLTVCLLRYNTYARPSRCVSRRISRLYPACTRHPFRSTSSVISYLRSNLTADS